MTRADAEEIGAPRAAEPDLVGLTVSKTAFGGAEIVSVMRRKRDR